jgi:hypothetical protein
MEKIKLVVKKPINDKIIPIEKIKDNLSKQSACYVLLTCTDPDKDGKMNVDFAYEGDEILAAYLIDNAQKYFDEKIIPSKDAT